MKDKYIAFWYLFVISSCSTFLFGQSNDTKEGIVDSLVITAIDLNTRGKYSEVITLATESQNLAKVINYKKGIADTEVQRAKAHQGLGAFSEALVSYRRAFEIRKNILKDSCAAAEVLNNMVSALDEQYYYEEDTESLDTALFYSRAAELLLENLDCYDTKTRIFVNRANIYENMDDIQQAINYNQKGLALFKITQDTAVKIIGQYGLAKRFIANSQLDSARLQLEQALRLSKDYSEVDSLLIGRIYEALGVVAMDVNLPQKALSYFQLADSSFSGGREDQTNLTYLYFNIAQAYELSENYLAAAKAYQEAMYYHQNNHFVSKNFYEMLATQRTLMKVKEEKRKYERNLFLALVTLFIISIILFIVVLILYKKERSNSELKEKHNQLKHDIVKNGLVTINNHIIADLPKLSNSKYAREALLKVRRMSKKILAQIGYEESDGKELQKLKFFVKEMHQRASEIAMIEVDNYSYLDEVEDYLLSKNLRNNLEGIITEAFTNIYKYASCSTASICFNVDENGLTLLIQDDGKGCELGVVNRSGLNTISQRVKALNGSVYFSSSPDKGFNIKVNISRFPENS